MLVWVLYDIENDRSRSKTAKACLQAGLYRVQYSCFLGTLTPASKSSLSLQIEELIDTDKDKVYIFPMSQDELRNTVLLGQAFDRKLVKDEVTALFL
ncbi:CRISPR-associated endonuclease Cas2 [Dyadobacter tibetensis]|uniref:CRISPR-associated endonuclease Cas2 n=1 Tax=Dyadobacter tibetensis TaxID=1211851 RepID=UPI0004724615|nr:CRISPR-associated endonuclease Cas2 [Dyadobacter tibetensis]